MQMKNTMQTTGRSITHLPPGEGKSVWMVGTDLITLMHQALQEVAQGCKCPLSKGIPLLCFASCCTVLRSGGVRVVSKARGEHGHRCQQCREMRNGRP
jgi:hypothetical protein